VTETLESVLRNARALVCPSFSPNWTSTYYLGLRSYIPESRIHYDAGAFPRPRLRHFKGFSVLLKLEDREIRLHFDPRDQAELDPGMLCWSDIYGKVNVSRGLLPETAASKVVPLGPGFGLRIWNTRGIIKHGLLSFAARRSFSLVKAWQYAVHFSAQFLRGFEDWYMPGTSESDYVFFIAAAYSDQPEVNSSRAAFMRLARAAPGLTFEGGFPLGRIAPLIIVRRRHSLALDQDLTVPHRYPFSEYVWKTKRSCVAFNNPAVQQSFSWKLGEFLAMGKAIISLPLTREPPSPLVHGEHMHFVSGDPEETRDALALLRHDHAYRRRLELNARAYYDRFLTPAATVGRVLAAAVERARGARV
jgi:hypothetical protein